MSFTLVTVTGTFQRPDGSPAQGSVIATLSVAIRNSGVVLDPTPVMGVLNGAGQLLAESLGPFTLEANDDPGTTPPGSTYSFVIELDNSPVREFSAIVPHTPGTVDLSVLGA